MSTTVQPLAVRLVERLVELADRAIPGRRPIRARIGVVDEPAEARAGAGRRPLQHLQVAVGVAEGEDRPAADEAVDADRLAGPVVDEVDLRLFASAPACRRAISNLILPEEPTTCSGGMP